MKYDACNECSHRPDAIARTEDILFWGGLGLSRLTGLWSPAGTPPEGIVSELNEVGQAVIPYMEKLKNTPAKLLMFTRYLYLLGVQRGCELFRNETLGGGVEMKKVLKDFEFRYYGGYMENEEMETLPYIKPDRIEELFKPFGFTFTEKGEITNV